MTTVKLLGSSEVCTSLEIDRSTLSRWIQRGLIKPALQMPGKSGAFLFDPVEVGRVKRERNAVSA